MIKKQLIDYTRWLWDMDRIKLDTQVKFESPVKMVDFYLPSTLPTKKTSTGPLRRLSI